MYPEDNEAGKRTSGSLPPVSPFSKTPLISYPAGSPDFSPGPPAVTQPSSQVLSFPLNTSSMFPPPWNPSASSFCDSLQMWSPSPSSSLPPPSPSLFGGSPSTPLETGDCSVGFNQNHSFPPSRPNSIRVSDTIVPPRVAHKRANNVMIDTNDMITQRSPEMIYSKPIESGGDLSSRGNESMEELFDEINKLNEENGNNTRSDSSGETTLGVKRRANNNIDPLRRRSHKRSASTDSYFNKVKNQSPCPNWNLQCYVSSTNLVDRNENPSSLQFENGPYTPNELLQISTCKRLTEVASDPKKVRKILANREATALSKERKSRYIIELENKVTTLEKENASTRDKIPILKIDEAMKTDFNKKLKDQVQTKELELQIFLKVYLTENLKAERDRLKVKRVLNEQLIPEIQQLKGTSDEIMQNLNQAERSNMQFMDTNMLNQSNNNQFNQEQTNSGFENPDE